jgi:hypothetical protein
LVVTAVQTADRETGSGEIDDEVGAEVIRLGIGLANDR